MFSFVHGVYMKPSADSVEELEKSVWSVVRPRNESEDQGEGVQWRSQVGHGAMPPPQHFW